MIGARSYRVAYPPFAVSRLVHCNWNASSSCRCILAHRLALDHQSTVAAASQHDTTATAARRWHIVVRTLPGAAQPGGGIASAVAAITPHPCALQCASCIPPNKRTVHRLHQRRRSMAHWCNRPERTPR